MAATFLLGRVFAPGNAAAGNAAAPPPPRVYELNERLSYPLPMALQPAERALVIALDSRCPYCTASMAFYRQLEKARRPDTKIVVIGREPETVLRAYAQQHSLQPDVIASVPRDHLKFLPTPFVLLARADGRVIDSWAGLLDKAREQEVLRAMKYNRSP